MADSTARFALPFILPGQAQKEASHNEALTLLDAALHASVAGNPTDEIPPDPAPGESWIVGPAATGAWGGRAHHLATWTDGGWRFVAPVPGMTVWKLDADYRLHWTGTAWSDGNWPVAALTIGDQQVVGPRLEAVPSPSGGTIIDVEARAAVESVIVALRTHGLIE
jgi:Protein of unknown function (DUF2793)